MELAYIKPLKTSKNFTGPLALYRKFALRSSTNTIYYMSKLYFTKFITTSVYTTLLQIKNAPQASVYSRNISCCLAIGNRLNYIYKYMVTTYLHTYFMHLLSSCGVTAIGPIKKSCAGQTLIPSVANFNQRTANLIRDLIIHQTIHHLWLHTYIG